MRKVIILLLALLLAFPAAAEDAEDYTAARAYADALQERFGVTVLIGDECKQVATDRTFTIGSEFLTHSPLKKKDTVNQLTVVEKALGRYPEGFFWTFRKEATSNGFRIVLADQLVNRDPKNTCTAYHLFSEGYDNIFLAYGDFTEAEVHHEIWHCLERRIAAKDPGALANWDQLNPAGFAYSHDDTKLEGFNPDYFYRDYGVTNAEEDRATVAEAVFLKDAAWWARHPILRMKMNTMNGALKAVTDFRYEIADVVPVTGIGVPALAEDGKLFLIKGRSKTLRIEVQPANATDPEVAWTSSDPGIAEADSSAGPSFVRITAKSTGTAVITGTARDGSGKSVKLTVNVEMKFSLADTGSGQKGKVSGDPWFINTYKNTSGYRTADSLTLRYYVTDAQDKPLKAAESEDIYREETFLLTIKPGKTGSTPRILLTGYEGVKRIYCAVIKVHYTDGTTVEADYPDYWYWTY